MASRDNILYNTENRLFYISDDIDNETIGKLCFNLLNLIHEDDKNDEEQKDYKRKPIKLYVSTQGGAMWYMWSLIDIMLNSKTPIHTYCSGIAASCGFLIFITGHKRFMYKHAFVLHHQASGGLRGTLEDIQQNAIEYEKQETMTEEHVLLYTNITKERLKEVREKKLDWYIYSEDAIALGIADEII